MNSRKVVVIEDNQEIRENICEILELANYQVWDAPNGKIGVECVKENKPDVILCDIMMPKLDGYGVLKILSSLEETRAIPFIFLTAKTEKKDFREGMNLGADDYLAKPFNDYQLLNAIEIRLKRNSYIINGISEFFKDVNQELNLENIGKNTKEQQYTTNEKIYREGQFPKQLFLVVAGQVKIIKANNEGKVLIVNILKAGDFFGYQTLLENIPYYDSAISLNNSSIISLPKDDFFKMAHSSPKVYKAMFKMIAKDYARLEERLLELAYESVRKRVANSLLLLHDKNTKQLNENLKVKRDVLASIAGAAKETVTRVLTDLKTEGLITVENTEIQIQDLDSLRTIIS